MSRGRRTRARRRRRARAAAAFLAVTVLAACGGARDPRTPNTAGRVAPAFRLDAVRAGDPAVELAAHRGTPVVVNFWASWCTPCVKEMPALQKAHERYGDRVVFLGVDGNDSRRLALALMARTGVTYPSGYDPRDGVYRAYRLVGRPTTVFVGPDGRIKGIHAGQLEGSDIDELITKYLGVRA